MSGDKIIFQMTPEQGEELMTAFREGWLQSIGIVSVREIAPHEVSEHELDGKTYVNAAPKKQSGKISDPTVPSMPGKAPRNNLDAEGPSLIEYFKPGSIHTATIRSLLDKPFRITLLNLPAAPSEYKFSATMSQDDISAIKARELLKSGESIQVEVVLVTARKNHTQVYFELHKT